jgi:hypothetical protein
MCFKLKDPFRTRRAARDSFVAFRTRFKRMRTGNKKARLTAAERRAAEAVDARQHEGVTGSYTIPTPAPQPVAVQQMVAQGNIDPFVAQLPGTYDVEEARYNGMNAFFNSFAYSRSGNWIPPLSKDMLEADSWRDWSK